MPRSTPNSDRPDRFQPSELKDLEENLQELLARCRQLRRESRQNSESDRHT
jgi:hypothetical protein